MTLNQVIKELEKIAKAHKQVNTFAFGDFHEINTSGDIVYPLVWTFYNGANVTEGVQSFNFSLVFCDVVKQGEVNETEVLSDQLEVAKDFIAQLQNSQLYDWEFIEDNIEIQPFTERWTDSVSGYSVNVSLRIPFIADRCSIPMEGISGGGLPPSGGDCLDATVVNSDNSYIQLVVSGGTLVLPDTVYNIYVDNVLQNTVSVPTLKNETINILWQ